MAIIDFKEIPKANVANGNQDVFELFAREFFHALGFFVLEDPDRGQDGGRDIIISESQAPSGPPAFDTVSGDSASAANVLLSTELWSCATSAK